MQGEGQSSSRGRVAVMTGAVNRVAAHGRECGFTAINGRLLEAFEIGGD